MTWRFGTRKLMIFVLISCCTIGASLCICVRSCKTGSSVSFLSYQLYRLAHGGEPPEVPANFSGVWRTWYYSGAPMEEFGVRHGQKQGLYNAWDEQGWLLSSGSYLDGEKEGPWEIFYADGKLFSRAEYSKGHPQGEVLQWDRDGNVVSDHNVIRGVPSSASTISSTDALAD